MPFGGHLSWAPSGIDLSREIEESESEKYCECFAEFNTRSLSVGREPRNGVVISEGRFYRSDGGEGGQKEEAARDEEGAEEEEDLEMEPTLCASLQSMQSLAIHVYGNKFNRAMRSCSRWSQSSLYHSLAKGALLALRALLSLNKDAVEEAISCLKSTLSLSESQRRPSTFKDYIVSPSQDDYTPEQLHAELISTESSILLGFLNLLHEQSLFNILGFAWKLKTSHGTYNRLFSLFESRDNLERDIIWDNFEAGVRIGVGGFNIGIAQCPPVLLNMLKLIGLSGDKKYGMDQIYKAMRLKGTIRGKFILPCLLAYNIYGIQLFGLGKPNEESIDQLMQEFKYKESQFYILFEGKRLQLRGQMDEAITKFKHCTKIQQDWKELHNLCYFDIMFCYGAQCKWKEAANYALVLANSTKWTPAIFAYFQAAFLYEDDLLKETHRDEITQSMREIPHLIRNFAGRNLPREAFVAFKAKEYIKSGGTLFMPGLEMLYLFNAIPYLMKNSMDLLAMLLKTLQEKEQRLQPLSDRDNCFVLLLKGVCLREMGLKLEAKQLFLNIFQFQNLGPKVYIHAFTAFELGITLLALNETREGKEWLYKARRDFSGYPCEPTLLFKVHNTLLKLQNQ